MSAYMTSVLACAAVTALCAIMSPEDGTTGKYIKYISGIVSLSVIVSPLLSALRSPPALPDIPDAETYAGYETYDIFAELLKKAEGDVAETIKHDAARTFGLKEDDISVTVSLSGEDMSDVRISYIAVSLTGDAVWTDAAELERYIKENYDKEAEVGVFYE